MVQQHRGVHACCLCCQFSSKQDTHSSMPSHQAPNQSRHLFKEFDGGAGGGSLRMSEFCSSAAVGAAISSLHTPLRRWPTGLDRGRSRFICFKRSHNCLGTRFEDTLPLAKIAFQDTPNDINGSTHCPTVNALPPPLSPEVNPSRPEQTFVQYSRAPGLHQRPRYFP